jgi:hypothetical protein
MREHNLDCLCQQASETKPQANRHSRARICPVPLVREDQRGNILVAKGIAEIRE